MYSKVVTKIMNEINKVIIGKNVIVCKALTAILASGHILIEDVPGVGKTTLALAFSKVMAMNYNRVQFTPDVLPTDVLGYHILKMDSDDYKFKAGPIACNLFLADEINRTSPKTQSSLLEVMEEGNITLDGVTRQLPKPFTVIATQNPVGSIGTQLLPESQLDRFMIKLTMGYPDIENEINILKGKQNKNVLQTLVPVVTKDDIVAMQREVERIYIHDAIYSYIANLIYQTRNHAYIELGVSPRGGIALMNMAKAHAYINNRDYMIPNDVKEVFHDVVKHRILLKPKARINDITMDRIIDELLQNVRAPKVI